MTEVAKSAFKAGYKAGEIPLHQLKLVRGGTRKGNAKFLAGLAARKGQVPAGAAAVTYAGTRKKVEKAASLGTAGKIVRGRKIADKVTRTSRIATVQQKDGRAVFAESASRPGGKILKPKSEMRVTTSALEGNEAGTAYERTGGGFTRGAKRTAAYGGAGTVYGGLIAIDRNDKKKQRKALEGALSKGTAVEVSKSAFSVGGYDDVKPAKSMRSQGLAFKDKAASKRARKEVQHNQGYVLRSGTQRKENWKTFGRTMGHDAGVGTAAGLAAAAATRRPGLIPVGASLGADVGVVRGSIKVQDRAIGQARQAGIKRGDITTGNNPKDVGYLTGRKKKKALSKSDTTSAFGVEHEEVSKAFGMSARGAKRGLKMIQGAPPVGNVRRGALSGAEPTGQFGARLKDAKLREAAHAKGAFPNTAKPTNIGERAHIQAQSNRPGAKWRAKIT